MFPVGSPNYYMLSLYSRQLPKADIQSTIFCLFVTFVPLWCHCYKRRREWKASHMTTLRSFTGRVMRGYLTFNKQYKQKNEQHIMIISWVTEIHAEKFSLPCNITKWVLHLNNLSAPLSYVAQVPSASVSVDADWDDGSFWKLRSPSLKSHWCCCAFIAWNSCYWIPPTTTEILRSRFRVFVYL